MTEKYTFKYSNAKRDKNPETQEFIGKYYLTNKTLYPATVRAKKEGKVTNELAEMLLLLARNYVKKSQFSGYTEAYKEDMISQAMINLSVNALKFDSDNYENAFSYFTTCIHRSFIQYLISEKKHRRIRDKALIEAGENPSFNFTDEMSNQGRSDEGGYREEFMEFQNLLAEAKEREAKEVERDALAKSQNQDSILTDDNAEEA